MKRAFLLAAALLAPASSQAAEFGIGATVRSEGGAIYVPIDFGQTLRVEPFFALAYGDSDGNQTGWARTLQTGVGVFARMQPRDHLQTYLGARAGYVDTETRSANPGGFGFSSYSHFHGYTLEPTLGVEYFVTERLSVGLETFLSYDNSSFNNVGFRTEGESVSSGNRLLARFFF